MDLFSSWMSGPLLPREKLVDSLEALIAPKARWRKKCVESMPWTITKTISVSEPV
jgi:hypothetical protein